MCDPSIIFFDYSEEAQKILVAGIKGKTMKHPMDIKVKHKFIGPKPDNCNYQIWQNVLSIMKVVIEGESTIHLLICLKDQSAWLSWLFRLFDPKSAYVMKACGFLQVFWWYWNEKTPVFTVLVGLYPLC